MAGLVGQNVYKDDDARRLDTQFLISINSLRSARLSQLFPSPPFSRSH